MKESHFDELTAFMAIADKLSFARAARHLGVSPTVASRRIAALESRLGARLLNRTTRSVSMTEAGAELVADLAPVMAGFASALERAAGRDRGVRGRLRINLPRIAAGLVVTPMLPGFAKRHPDVSVELVVEDHSRDIVAEGFDAGIRLGGMIHKDMVSVRITRDLRMAVVGSPTYLRDREKPKIPSDLTSHRCLRYRFGESGTYQQWLFQGESGQTSIDPVSVITANDTDTLLNAALDGMGLAYLGDLLVEKHVAAGHLVTLLSEYCRPFSGFHLYHSSRRLVPPPLRAFIDFLRSGSHTNLR